jgi:hypothetical protein
MNKRYTHLELKLATSGRLHLPIARQSFGQNRMKAPGEKSGTRGIGIPPKIWATILGHPELHAKFERVK